MLTIRYVRQDSGMDGYGEIGGTDTAGFRLSLVTYGKCVYWIGDRKVVMGKGEAILIPDRYSYYWKSVPTVFHSKWIISFALAGEPPSLPMLAGESWIHGRLGCYDLVHERIKAIHAQWTEKQPYYEVMAGALLVEVLALWSRELKLGTPTSEKHAYVEAMKAYMQEHYRESINKEVLGEVIRKSPNHAATLFKTATGQAISEYVHALRIKTAVYMLTESQLTVGEISEFLGYRDVSYFNRMFKKLTGRVPSDYLGDRPSRGI